MTMFEEILGFQDASKLPPVKTAPDPPWDDDPLWPYKPASDASLALCNKIQDAAFVREMIGEVPAPLQSVLEPEPMFSAPGTTVDLAKLVDNRARTNDASVENLLAKAGKPGAALRKLMVKRSYSLSEGMAALLKKFEEFFSKEEQRLMEKQIAALDVAGFCQMLNEKVYVTA